MPERGTESDVTEAAPGAGPSGERDFDDGRYLYCVVRVADGTPLDDADLPAGVDGEPPRVVDCDGLAAVVQSSATQYDSDDVDTVKEWLLQHQAVVDEAGRAFGTPLPFRFDTVLAGDDDQVREWVESERDALSRALEDIAGRWEYRVDLLWNADGLATAVVDELDDLRERTADAGEGTAFLLEKQYESRRESLIADRRDEVVTAVVERLEAIASDVQRVDRSTANSLLEDASRQAASRTGLAVLAASDREDAIGEVLDEVIENPGVDVRFTGPWPPYSFAATVGESA